MIDLIKKMLYIMTVVLGIMLFCGLSANAAPTEMNGLPRESGLLCIDIYNPETVVSTTTQSDYVLSGVAKSGVVVSVYYREKSTGKYKLVHTGGTPAVQTIGASGYFAQRISLTEGKNNILVRVDANGNSQTALQIVELEINLLVDSFWDRFRSTSQNMEMELRNAFR